MFPDTGPRACTHSPEGPSPASMAVPGSLLKPTVQVGGSRRAWAAGVGGWARRPRGHSAQSRGPTGIGGLEGLRLEMGEHFQSKGMCAGTREEPGPSSRLPAPHLH